MTTSGTTNFDLTGSSLILESFDRCGIRPAEITREHMSSAVRSANFELSTWSDMPVNLWKVSLVQFTLIQGQDTYIFDKSVQLLTDAYVTLVQGDNAPIDRILIPISRDEYAEYPDKTQQAAQSVYWFQRDTIPQVTVWPVPDGQSETYLNCYVMNRSQDVTNVGSQNIDVPYRFIDALVARVAVRLSVKFAPEKYQMLSGIAKETYQTAFFEDQERANIRIMPDFGIYQV